MPPEGKWVKTNTGQLCTNMEWSEHAEKSHPWSSFSHKTRQSQKKMLETDFDSERIMKTRLNYEHRNETIIQIYAPCNHTYSEEEKAEFFEKFLAQLTQYQTTIISSSWETSMKGRPKKNTMGNLPWPTQWHQYRM